MRMTRRQATMIIGLLFSMFLIVGIASYRESSQAQDASQNRQLLPLVAGGRGVQSSDAEESPVEEPTEEPGGESEEVPPEILAQMREQALEIAANMQIIPASGIETMGFTITVAGQDIKLPDDVYIEATVIDVECMVGTECPETPLYVLRYKDAETRISVGQTTGQIDDYAPTAEGVDANRAAFQWLIDAIEAITEENAEGGNNP